MKAAARAGLLLAVLLVAACAPQPVYEARSEYSHIRVLDKGAQRSLVFVGERAKVEVVETLIDLREPHRLQHAYARGMMAGLLFLEQPQACLLIGLGGGALVRFLQHHFPRLQLDVVEIDPVVVDVAREYFGARPGERTRIIVDDAYRFVARSEARYDVVLVDAHLHPGEGTDSTGHPNRLKGDEFMRNVQARLDPGGVAMFNMIEGRDAEGYLGSVRRAFAHTRTFRPPGSGNLVVAASAVAIDDAALRRRAQALDARGGFGFSFASVLDQAVTR